MRIKFEHFLVFLLLMLIMFTYAQAANQLENNQYINILQNHTLFSEKSDSFDGHHEESIPSATAASIKLPTSLKIIDDSAFEGTALVSVDIPESVSYIGDNAFANIPTLLSVRIPDTTQFIGRDAFANSIKVTLTASSNSYARTWAKENGFRFQLLATFNASNGVVSYSFQSNPGFHSFQRERTETTDKTNTNIRERRTGRTVGELKASRYKGVAALHIQSRYFP